MSIYDGEIVCDPGRMSGAPCIAGTRIDVETIALMMWEHGPVEVTGGWDYVSKHAFLLACWYYVEHGPGFGRRPKRAIVDAWKPWLLAVRGRLSSSDGAETVPWPPQRLT